MTENDDWGNLTQIALTSDVVCCTSSKIWVHESWNFLKSLKLTETSDTNWKLRNVLENLKLTENSEINWNNGNSLQNQRLTGNLKIC